MDNDNRNSDYNQPSDRYNPEVINETYRPSQINTDNFQSQQEFVDSEPGDPINNDNPVYWSGKEYISHDKDAFWFIIFAIVVISFIALDIFLIKSYTFSFLVVVMAAAILILSHRPAREINYTLSGREGLYIGERLYRFDEFRAFGLLEEDDNNMLVLIPTKRFALSLSVYFPEQAGEEIVDIFGSRLPMEKVKFDFVDIIVRKLRI